MNFWGRALDVAAGEAALGEVLLVVFFGAPKGLRRLDPGDDAFGLEKAFDGELGNFGFGLCLLLGGVKEDGRAVLAAPVGALAVKGGGVVKGEEGVEDVVVGGDGRVEVELDDFGVAGCVGADVFVAGPLHGAAFIANRCCCHAGKGREGSLDTPETSRSESRFFHAHTP